MGLSSFLVTIDGTQVQLGMRTKLAMPGQTHFVVAVLEDEVKTA
jgi:hypothetical protein